MVTLSSVVITMIVGLVLMQYAHGQTTNETITNQTSMKVPTGKFESKAFTIKDLKAVEHDGNWEVSGTIKNITNETITGTTIMIQYYNSEERIQTSFTHPQSALEPGQEYSFSDAPYRLGLDVDHYKITMSSDR
jgi:hypothetical protein